ncbi:hypothetical protein [Rothia sp. ZJ932]|uniref:hypothetical protein n=1 Tax=Rothia sp. ZJ932 TaxID=2810516 RepID=UPI001968800B|nr:hypothetical protein [Rothia sp. ZJ932]QRZ61489.1 hypothetical protein JR346_09760 [Rothia sp. ZJ932]
MSINVPMELSRYTNHMFTGFPTGNLPTALDPDAGDNTADAQGNNSGSFFGIAAERKALGLDPSNSYPLTNLLTQL